MADVTSKKTGDAVRILKQKYVRTNKDRELFEQARTDGDVAQQIHDARKKAGLSQRALAKLVGTSASVICQLEDADYEGHSFTMLRRIAKALGKRVEIRLVTRRVSRRSQDSAAI